MYEVINVDTIAWAYNELIRLGMGPKHPFMERLKSFIECPDVLLKEINHLEKDLIRTRLENIKLDEALKNLEEENSFLKEKLYCKTDYYKVALEKERELNDC